ncbi:MAG: 30S ribosome-binding factor RbfA [Nitrospirae bacterium]|jgi:ribosome-binding factor A|nr:30S ribosome-binding factor RbfA [Nitrospirota bacterium]
MHPYKRSQRVSDLLREEIADIITYKLKDPRIGFVTVTGVDVTEDIKMASVYVSVLREGEKKSTIEILNDAKSFIRSELSKRLRMKFIPSIEFRLDVSSEYGSRIEKLLNEIRRKDEGSS